MRRLLTGSCVLLVLAVAAASSAQELEPKAMTKEEIEKQLQGAARFTGEVLLNGKQLCSLDSDKAQPYPWRMLNQSESRPDTWAAAGQRPTLVIKLSSDAPEHLLLTKRGGTPDKRLILLEREPRAPTPTYNVQLIEALEPGDYEFATKKGNMAFFFRCGFTVEK